MTSGPFKLRAMNFEPQQIAVSFSEGAETIEQRGLPKQLGCAFLSLPKLSFAASLEFHGMTCVQTNSCFFFILFFSYYYLFFKYKVKVAPYECLRANRYLLHAAEAFS